jgi:hypothetical protein
LLASGSAPALGTAHAKATTASTPQLTVTMSGKDSPVNLVGPHRFSAGRVDVTLVAGSGEQAFLVLRLHKGYTMADFRRDFGTFGQAQQHPTPAALKALRRLVKHTTFCGGLDSGTGHKTVTGSIVFPKADTYYVFNDNGGPNPNVAPVKLHVSARAGSRPTPAFSAVVKATTSKRFRGSTHLPASGTIEFKNDAKDSPHLLFLQHVKKGTTRKQVIKALQSSGPGPMRPGAVGIDVLSPGRSATITYTLPAGDYAELCFFPDLKTGMPHAFMGMVRIVHLS